MKTVEISTLKRSECGAILPLVLKSGWYDMIARGEKHEEYRLATTYWLTRLSNWDGKSKIPVVEFRRGYARNAPRMAFWCMGLSTAGGMKPYALVDASVVKTRHPEWGEPEEEHFFIKLGGRVDLF